MAPPDALPTRLSLHHFPPPLSAIGNIASPKAAGYWQQGAGWVSTVALNASFDAPPLVLYTVFDVGVGLANSVSSRVYKQMTYTPVPQDAGGDGTKLKTDFLTFPLWTVIINLDKGIPTAVGWDDGCFFCASNTPACGFVEFNANASVSSTVPDNTFRSCSTAQATCNPNFPLTVNATVYNTTVYNTTDFNTTDVNGTATNQTVVPGLRNLQAVPDLRNSTVANGTAVVDSGCDLKVFITWTGTDRNGAYMTSANKRFSRYRAFAVATAFQSAINLGNSAIDIGNTVFSSVEGIPGRVTNE